MTGVHKACTEVLDNAGFYIHINRSDCGDAKRSAREGAEVVERIPGSNRNVGGRTVFSHSKPMKSVLSILPHSPAAHTPGIAAGRRLAEAWRQSEENAFETNTRTRELT